MNLNLNLNLCPKYRIASCCSSSSSQHPTRFQFSQSQSLSHASNKIAYTNGGARGRARSRAPTLTVRSSLDTAGPTATVGQVTEVNKDTFWPIVKAAGDKTVVLDMYTQWYIFLIHSFYLLIFLSCLMCNCSPSSDCSSLFNPWNWI